MGFESRFESFKSGRQQNVFLYTSTSGNAQNNTLRKFQNDDDDWHESETFTFGYIQKQP